MTIDRSTLAENSYVTETITVGKKKLNKAKHISNEWVVAVEIEGSMRLKANSLIIGTEIKV
jgi:hypothetical protein